MGEGCICQCDESLYGIQSRQDTNTLLSETTPVARGVTRTSAAFQTAGHSVLRIMGKATGVGIADGDFEIRIEESQVCPEDPTDPNQEDFREVARFISKEDADNNQYISTKYSPNAGFVRFVEVGPAGAVVLAAYNMTVIAQPIGCCDPGMWAGTGSPFGPGARVATRADLAVPAGVNANILVAADIPRGTRRVTIKNVGANPIRMKGTGEGGGAGRGPELIANETFSFGTRDGAMNTLDGFSAAGTTLAYFFERD